MKGKNSGEGRGIWVVCQKLSRMTWVASLGGWDEVGGYQQKL